MKQKTIITSILFIYCFLFFTNTSFAQYINPEISKYAFNGVVRTIVEDSEGNVYFGGDFTEVGIYSGSGVLFNSDGSFPQSVPDNLIDGVVHTIINFPGGGWLIGGLFTSVNGTARNNLARINANGTLHSFAPVINGAVRALAFDSEGELYVGGSFTQVNGVTRNRLCKFNATFELSTFNPNLNQDVNALAVDATDRLYVGGSFTSIANTPRSRLCRFQNNGALQAFNPSPNGPILAIAIDDLGNVYVGGTYTVIGNSNRDYLCKFNNSDVVTSFFSNPNGRVRALAIDNDNGVFVGGDFTTVNGNAVRNHLCHYNAVGNLTSFNPSLDDNVQALTLDQEGSLYVGGNFENIGGNVVRKRFCKFLNDGTLSPLDIAATDNNLNLSFISALAVNSNGQIYVGGDFHMVHTVDRSYFCKFNNDGEISDYSPRFDSYISIIKVSENDELYVGGGFSSVDNNPRESFCKFDANGDLNSFNPLFNSFSSVNDIALDNFGNVYAGGTFTAVNGVQRNRLCKFEVDGSLSDFNPDMSASVEALVTDDEGNLYVGGNFSFVGGVIRRKLCKFDSNGVLQPLSVYIWGIVLALALDADNNLYVGGEISEINGTDLSGLCLFDSMGQLTDWDSGLSGTANELHIDDNGSLYVGGNFSFVNGEMRNGLCKFENTGELASLGAFTNQLSVVSILVHSNGLVYAGGAFFKRLNIYSCSNIVAQSNNPFLCQGESVSVASHSTQGADGIGVPEGLPIGVEATWNEGEIIISGTPLEVGSFEYTIPITGDCEIWNTLARGVIMIGNSPSTSEASYSPTLCIQTPLTTITHTTTNAYAILYENISGVNGLPLGVRAIWNDNLLSIIGTPTQAGIFEYSIPVYGECGEVSATGIIVVNSADVSVTNSDTLLTATAVEGTYQWIDCGSNLSIEGETNASFAPSVSGSYAVTVSVNGCSFTSDCENVIIIGVDESIVNRDLIVFPNPTSGTIQIDLTSQTGFNYFELKNILGQTILSSRLNGENILSIDIPGEAGTYFIELFKADGAKEVVKVSKQ